MGGQIAELEVVPPLVGGGEVVLLSATVELVGAGLGDES